MELYQMEVEEAVKRISATGRDKDDFSFSRSYLPPDPDGGGMFTVQYEIEISNKKTSKSLSAIGGIGSNWVDYFTGALEAGYFD